MGIDPKEIDPIIRDLFEKYRTGTIEVVEKDELFGFLDSVRDIPGFNLRTLAIGGLQYGEIDYKRLNGEWYRRRRRAERLAKEKPTPTTEITKKKEDDITKGATDKLFEEIKDIGSLLVNEYAGRASERNESLKVYVIKSIQMREEYGDQIELLKQENDMLKALCSLFVEAVKPQFRQMAAQRMYLDWITGLLQLRALGIELDPAYVDQVTARLEQVMGITLL